MITVSVDIPKAVGELDRVATQLRFATALALNLTAKAAQDAERARVRSVFILRRAAFLERNVVKIDRADFARKDRLAVRLHLDDRVGFFEKFEQGGQKLGPTYPVAIPSSRLRPDIRKTVPLGLYPKSLRLAPRRDVVGVLPATRRSTRTGTQLVGKRGTFVLDPREQFGVKTWGVYQRTGRGPGAIRLLWTYKSKIPIPRRLAWYETLTTTAQRAWPKEFGQALGRALATAR